jgi:hypothetical protein
MAGKALIRIPNLINPVSQNPAFSVHMNPSSWEHLKEAKKTVVGVACAEHQSVSRDLNRERDAPTTNLQLGDAPFFFLLPSSFFLLPSSFFLLPSSLKLVTEKNG